MIEKEKIVVKQIRRLEKRRNKLNIEIAQQRELLELICTHSDTYEDTEYHEGSYYNKSEYITVRICKICNKKWELKRETGGYN